MARCDRCQKEIDRILDDYGWGNWLKLLYYFDHELSEEEITPATYNEMTNALMTFKPWISITLEEKK
jgi:hypothetical protein